jgi:hypothetical protein
MYVCMYVCSVIERVHGVDREKGSLQEGVREGGRSQVRFRGWVLLLVGLHGLVVLLRRGAVACIWKEVGWLIDVYERFYCMH